MMAGTRFAADMALRYLDVTLAANERFSGLAGALDATVGGGGRAFSQAVLRSGEEARAVRETAGEAAAAAFLARVGGLSRSQLFLSAQAGIAAGERVGRGIFAGAGAGVGPSGYAWLPRTALIGTVAADLYLGYAALRARDRLGSDLVDGRDWELEHRRGAARALDASTALGGAMIKASQFASSRPDILPAPYVEILSSLQDRVPPRPWPVIERTLERELGRGLKEVFSAVQPTPIAAASIAQVHRAYLRDGRAVALKVQYPEVASLVEVDLRALESVFGAISAFEPGIRLQPIADYLRWTLPMELDFVREAGAIRDLKSALSDRDDVVIPGVVGEISTDRLLVMDLVEGVKITDRAGLAAAGINPKAVARLLNDVYADQIYGRRYLHADPHPGNLLVQKGPEGDPRLVILDHGLTLPLEESLVVPLEKAMRGMYEGDFETVSAALREAGLELEEGASLDALLELVGVLLGNDPEETGSDEAGAAGASADLVGFGRSLGSGIGHIPPKLLLVGRAIGFLDGITRQLDPDLDALEIVSRRTGP